MNNVLIANNTFVNRTGNISGGEGNVIISPGTDTISRFDNGIVSKDDSFPFFACACFWEGDKWKAFICPFSKIDRA